MKLKSYGRYWAVYDETYELICVTLYKKGAQEVIRRLNAVESMCENLARRMEALTSAAERRAA